jgi:hypothetical protein
MHGNVIMSRQISPYSLKSLIKSALQAAKMEGAGFQSNFSDDSLPTNEEEVTEFIKKRSELYRETWIIKPLKTALEKLEKKNVWGIYLYPKSNNFRRIRTASINRKLCRKLVAIYQ